MKFGLCLLMVCLFSLRSHALVLFSDDFERNNLGNNWQTTSNAYIDINNLTANSPSRSLAFFSGAVIVSHQQSYDLSTVGSGSLSFWWRRGADSFSEDPDSGEDLLLQYLNDNGSWRTLITLSGSGTPGESDVATLTLPADALHDNFRFRFYYLGGSSTWWATDYWHIDDVMLESSEPLSCFNDTFQRGQLGDDWVASSVGGTFTPDIVGNRRLRLTQDVGNQSTATTLQRLFPASGNLITIEFNHYAWSPDGGTGADGIAVVFSDATITPQAGSFGGSLGYAQRDNGDEGFAGGWLGVAIDEWGNFSNNNEGRQGGIGLRRDSVSMRGSGSGGNGYRFITSTGTLNPEVDQRGSNSPGPGHRYRFVIDATNPGQVFVSVYRNTGSGFTPLIAPRDVAAETGQAVIPQDLLLSFTGSTGGSRNNHEIDDLQVCAQTINPINETIHHFEWSFSSTGLTCSPQQLTLRACDNADCSQLYTDPVSVNLSALGWLGGSTVSFSGGSTNLQLRQNTPATIRPEVVSSVPTKRAFETDVCIRDGVAGNNCDIQFYDSGFEFSVPNMIANKAAHNIIVKAVRKDDTTQACVPGFSNVTKAVSFWSDYASPLNGSRLVSVSSNGSGFNDIGRSQADATAVNLAFNNAGEATIGVNYNDAGLMQLNAIYTGNAEELGLVMRGSDLFVSEPAGFCVTAARLVSGSPGGGASGACITENQACDPFVAAAENFELSVQPVAWQQDNDADFCQGNISTPNFVAAVSLASSLVQPSGGIPGELTPQSYNHTVAANGINRLTVQHSEVGVFDFSAAVDDLYFSEVVEAQGQTQTAIGRFYPQAFRLQSASVTPACGAFSYMGDNRLQTSYQVFAVNQNGNRTFNYRDAFAFATPTLVAENNNNGIDLSARLTDIDTTNWINGELRLTDVDLRFTRPASGVDGPYQSLALGLQLSDNDASLAAVDMQAGSSGSCALNCDARQLGSTDVRFGSLYLANVFGPETMPLQQRLEAQYFDGTGFIVNADDNGCFTLAASTPPITELSYQGELDSGETNISVLQTISAGVGLLQYSAPGMGNSGQLNMSYQVPAWLQTENSADDAYDDDPAASITFGQFRGHDRVIYWREIIR